MAGAYVTTSRSSEQMSPVQLTIPGRPPQDHLPTSVRRVQQTTESYRTMSMGQVEKQLEADLVTQRNGFTQAKPSVHDIGHEFYTQKKTFQSSPKSVTAYGPNGFKLIAPLLVETKFGSSSAFPLVPKMSFNDQKYYGNKLMSSAAPTLPSANLSTWIGETVKDGLPSFGAIADFSVKTRFFQSLGGDYLNYQFGWKPFVMDLIKLFEAVTKSYELMAQYEKDSGNVVRRRRALPTKTEIRDPFTDLRASVQMPAMGSGYSSWLQQHLLAQRPNVQSSRSVTTDIWFSGAFTYYLNVGSKTLDKFKKYSSLAQNLLGYKITPQVLWELVPWSWLIDWKVGIQDALSVQEAFSTDQLVLKYGYLMRRTTALNQFTVQVPEYRENGSFLPGRTATQSFQVVQKERYRATPYGFGLNPEGFSPSQWAILAALGLSKGGKKLW